MKEQYPVKHNRLKKLGFRFVCPKTDIKGGARPARFAWKMKSKIFISFFMHVNIYKEVGKHLQSTMEKRPN